MRNISQVLCGAVLQTWIVGASLEFRLPHVLLLLRFLMFFLSSSKHHRKVPQTISDWFLTRPLQFTIEYHPVLRRYAALVTGKVKVVRVHAMKAYRGSGGIAPVILKLGSRCWWIVNIIPQPRPLHLRERTPGTHWMGRWVCRRVGLNVSKKRKISCPHRDSTPALSVRNLVIYTEYAVPRPTELLTPCLNIFRINK